MHKTWLVFRHEYLKRVLTRRFLFGLVSMPLFVLLAIGVGVAAVALQVKKDPIGYIDRSGWLQNPIYPQDTSGSFFPNVQIIPYADENQARSDLQSGKLQLLYVIAKDYLQSGQVTMIAKDPPGENAKSQFIDFIKENLLVHQPIEIAQRLLQGSSVTLKSLDGSRSMTGDSFMAFILPFINGLLLVILIAISGSYLLQAVIEEKENRTMEIVITSLSPNQLMTGKVFANLLVGITQLVVWFLFAILGLLVVQSIFHLGATPLINIGQVGLMAAIMLPAYVMVAALMTAVGATATEAREAQQVSGFFILPMVAPYWFFSIIMTYPNSPLSIALSLFPLTSPVTMPMRAVFTVVPIWQIILAIAILIFCALGALWLAGKVFHMGMLRYGKRLSLREIFTSKTQDSEG
jgi:ABC-2 type transport system permease protein